MAEDSVFSWVALTVITYGALILAIVKAVREKADRGDEDSYGR